MLYPCVGDMLSSLVEICSSASPLTAYASWIAAGITAGPVTNTTTAKEINAIANIVVVVFMLSLIFFMKPRRYSCVLPFWRKGIEKIIRNREKK